MSKITITLNDNEKRRELLELVENLPYIETVTVEETDQTINSGASIAARQPQNGTNGSALSTATTEVIAHDDPMDREIASFEEQHDQLVKKYLGEYIAMHQGQVIAHKNEMEPLIRAVRKIYPGKIVLYRQVQETLPPTLYFRSPRMVRD